MAKSSSFINIVGPQALTGRTSGAGQIGTGTLLGGGGSVLGGTGPGGAWTMGDNGLFTFNRELGKAPNALKKFNEALESVTKRLAGLESKEAARKGDGTELSGLGGGIKGGFWLTIGNQLADIVKTLTVQQVRERWSEANVRQNFAALTRGASNEYQAKASGYLDTRWGLNYSTKIDVMQTAQILGFRNNLSKQETTDIMSQIAGTGLASKGPIETLKLYQQIATGFSGIGMRPETAMQALNLSSMQGKGAVAATQDLALLQGIAKQYGGGDKGKQEFLLQEILKAIEKSTEAGNRNFSYLAQSVAAQVARGATAQTAATVSDILTPKTNVWPQQGDIATIAFRTLLNQGGAGATQPELAAFTAAMQSPEDRAAFEARYPKSKLPRVYEKVFGADPYSAQAADATSRGILRQLPASVFMAATGGTYQQYEAMLRITEGKSVAAANIASTAELDRARDEIIGGLTLFDRAALKGTSYGRFALSQGFFNLFGGRGRVGANWQIVEETKKKGVEYNTADVGMMNDFVSLQQEYHNRTGQWLTPVDISRSRKEWETLRDHPELRAPGVPLEKWGTLHSAPISTAIDIRKGASLNMIDEIISEKGLRFKRLRGDPQHLSFTGTPTQTAQQFDAAQQMNNKGFKDVVDAVHQMTDVIRQMQDARARQKGVNQK